MGQNAIREVKHIVDLSRAYRRHIHDEFAIAHVWKGSTFAWIDGQEVTISGECLVLIRPGVAHACNPVAASSWHYTQALLDPDVCSSVSRAFFDVPYRIVSSTDPLRKLFLALREERNEQPLEFLRVLGEAIAERTVAVRKPARSCALRQVVDHLAAHPAAALSLEELCQVAGLSKYHLVRSFKEAYGLTPHAYHLNLRVNAAKARLREGRQLAEVALFAGFCDQSHFTRVFARCVGMTPAAYQKSTAIPSKTPPRHLL